MAEKKSAEKTSVKSYQQDTEAEKQKMGAYSKKFKTTVRSLQTGFKKHARDMKAAASSMREEGIRSMRQKVGKFNHEIKDQVKENKEAVTRMSDNVKFFQSEINKKKKDFKAYAKGPFTNSIKAFHDNVDKEKRSFQAYARGPFQGYIKAFWG
ncbi:MAG: hypothetical protein AB1668_02190 [Nanoarchaeota archaeon]